MKHVQQKINVSERRACQVLGQARSTQRYEPQESDDEKDLITRIHELVRDHPRFGYRRIARLLRVEGWPVNVKRIYRLWRKEGLKVPKKQRKRRSLGTSDGGCIRHRAEFKDHVWSMDFIHDSTRHGTAFKSLVVLDEFTRECLLLEADRSITSDRVLDMLVQLFVARGVPKHLRCDNGPEFIAKSLRKHLENTDIETLYIEPGSPWENGYVESFNSRLRDELLNVEEFEDLAEARWHLERYRVAYNTVRPHSSLVYQTPTAFAERCATSASVATLPSLQRHTPPPQETPETITQTQLS